MNINRILKHPLLKSSVLYTISDAINNAVPFFILPVLGCYFFSNKMIEVLNKMVILMLEGNIRFYSFV